MEEKVVARNNLEEEKKDFNQPVDQDKLLIQAQKMGIRPSEVDLGVFIINGVANDKKKNQLKNGNKIQTESKDVQVELITDR